MRFFRARSPLPGRVATVYIFDDLVVVSDGENSLCVAVHPRRVGGDIWYQEDK